MKLVKKIKEIFGENCKLIIGDWSNKTNLKNSISTPNISIKRKINEYIPVYSINEANTSKIHHNTKEPCTRLRLWLKKKVTKDGKQSIEYKNTLIHSVLTYSMFKKSLEGVNVKKDTSRGCINRDKNAVNNMKYIVDYWFAHKSRPKEYKLKKRKNESLKSITKNTHVA